MISAMPMRLTASCIPVKDIAHRDVRAMFELHSAHYVSDEFTFFADLAKKSWVIQLFDEDENLRGFSTLVLWSHNIGDRDINVVFSGDTIIDPRYWGSRALPIKWLEVTGALHAQDSSTPLYWLLTSMHPRTYRSLPLFYRHFYPSWRADYDELARIVEHVGRARFGANFDASRGVVVGEGPLKPSVANIMPSNMDGADIRYFLERNPRHASGDELVCLARLEASNHGPVARRFFLRGAALGLVDGPRHLSAAE
ncbi:MAG: hypothetical protein ACREC3_13460 [Methyloceanibacter sp.]